MFGYKFGVWKHVSEGTLFRCSNHPMQFNFPTRGACWILPKTIELIIRILFLPPSAARSPFCPPSYLLSSFFFPHIYLMWFKCAQIQIIIVTSAFMRNSPHFPWHKLKKKCSSILHRTFLNSNSEQTSKVFLLTPNKQKQLVSRTCSCGFRLGNTLQALKGNCS